MSNAIETTRLCGRAGRDFAVTDLDLAVPAGAIYGFLGANGAGKSTTIRLLLGLTPKERGTIALLGEPVPRALPSILARTGYVPERPHLHRFLSVAETIAFHRSFYPRWDQGWAERMSASFGLPAGRRVGRLSKGELGKLMLLLALGQTPELLVLDEPTDGLDPVVRRDVLTAIVDYVARARATVFVSSHLVHELEGLCDWIGVMDRGRLICQLPMERFKNGIKRLVVSGRVERDGMPFERLVREPVGHGREAWVVEGWSDGMASWFDPGVVTLERVDDLDLEDGFVERLRARREEG